MTSGINVADGAFFNPDVPRHSIGGVDYFVSSKLFESDRSPPQTRYAEELYLMDGLTTRFEVPLKPKEVRATRARRTSEASAYEHR